MNRRDLCWAAILLVLHSTLWIQAQPAAAHSDLYGTGRWTTDLNVEYQFDAGVPSGARAAISAGADAWNAMGRTMRFVRVTNLVLQPYRSACSTSQYQNNGVFWTAPAAMLFPTAAGELSYCFNASDGRLRRTQVAFNSTLSWHMGLDATPAGQNDLASVATHEFGHATGSIYANAGHFSDSDQSVCPDNRLLHTMCESGLADSSRRSPEPHDIHSFAGAYGGETFCGHVVYGAIRTAFGALGTTGGPLGCPRDAERDAPKWILESDPHRGGRTQPFTGGSIHFHHATGAHAT
nr:hypothetical protein [Actinomycetota bacterium]